MGTGRETNKERGAQGAQKATTGAASQKQGEKAQGLQDQAPRVQGSGASAGQAAPQGALRKEASEKKGLQVRDLITLGIFAVIYLVLFFLGASLGVIPIMVILFPLPIALVTGIPNVLFYTKAQKFGMVTLMGTLLGIFFFFMGYGPLCIAFGVVCGLAADLIMRAGSYKSWKHMVAGHVVFSEWMLGTMMPMWILGAAYFEPSRASQGEAFVEQSMALVSTGSLVGVVVGIAVCALVGAFIGRAILKKHFERAGIA